MENLEKIKGSRNELNESLLKSLNEVHKFFKNHSKFKSKDYLISGETSLVLYGLSKKVVKKIKIYVDNRRKIEVYNNALKKAGLDELVEIISRKVPNILYSQSVYIKKEIDGEYFYTRIPTLEKLLVNIDSYSLLSDDKERVIKMLKERVNTLKLVKCINFNNKHRIKVSKEAKQVVSERTKKIFRVRTLEQSSLIDDVLKTLENHETILFGGIAVEKQTKDDRTTFDIDILGPESLLDSVLESLRKNFQIRDGKRGDGTKDFTTFSELGSGNKKSTILISRKEGKNIENIDLNQLLSVDFDHVDTTELIKNDMTTRLKDIGEVLAPETLICFKLATVFGCISNTKKGWKRRIVKDVIDIHLLTQSNDIDISKLKTIYNKLKDNGSININWELINRLEDIEKTEPDYASNLSNWIKHSNLRTMPIIKSVGLIRTLKENLCN